MRGVIRGSLAGVGVLIIAFALALMVPVSETMWGKILHVHGSVNVAAEEEEGLSLKDSSYCGRVEVTKQCKH